MPRKTCFLKKYQFCINQGQGKICEKVSHEMVAIGGSYRGILGNWNFNPIFAISGCRNSISINCY